MARITCKGAGIDGIARQLQRMGKNVEPACEKAVHEGGKLLAEKLKAACPVKTGTLQKGIKAEKPKVDYGGGVYCLVHPTGNQHGERNGAIAFYVEYGHGEGETKKPHPWWFPTIALSKDAVAAKVRETFFKEIEKGK